ncbi:hypothetical protein Pcinc_015145 [Petrolisthes cinctipes]|uniref:Uncharacterized protein n=1 Tax=Petrolisthes cinctipes TaxID=88211 RepID=A0AAE1FTR9_PETCI|nr:hypothetical protein Pcinc_015145 [Petrolisthes cinctipes]
MHRANLPLNHHLYVQRTKVTYLSPATSTCHVRSSRTYHPSAQRATLFNTHMPTSTHRTCYVSGSHTPHTLHFPRPRSTLNATFKYVLPSLSALLPSPSLAPFSVFSTFLLSSPPFLCCLCSPLTPPYTTRKRLLQRYLPLYHMPMGTSTLHSSTQRPRHCSTSLLPQLSLS